MTLTIDNVIFKSQADIEAHEKCETIRNYYREVRLFATTKNAACIEAMERIASKLVNQFGLTWSDIDDLEMDALTTM
ncbi:MAG: hypothetical protein II453_07265 [Alphaproteobacteria bacterium]|nr:hypothetical protein [Alphaproteobacteria bacterium]